MVAGRSRGSKAALLIFGVALFVASCSQSAPARLSGYQVEGESGVRFGVGTCNADLTIERVEETADAVTVLIKYSDASDDDCADSVLVELSSPLGARKVFDASTGDRVRDTHALLIRKDTFQLPAEPRDPDTVAVAILAAAIRDDGDEAVLSLDHTSCLDPWVDLIQDTSDLVAILIVEPAGTAGSASTCSESLDVRIGLLEGRQVVDASTGQPVTVDRNP